MTNHKRMKSLRRRKQLHFQGNKTGDIGFFGHLTPLKDISIGGIFPAILKFSKEFLARNPKDNAITQKVLAVVRKKKRQEAQARYKERKKAGVTVTRKSPTPVKPAKESKPIPKKVKVAVR